MKFTGSALVVQAAPRRIWDPRFGWQIGVRYRGPRPELEVIELGHRSSGRRTELDPDQQGGYGLLTVWYGSEDTQAPDAPLTDRWTLEGNDIEESPFAVPDIRTAYESASIAEKVQMRTQVESVLRGEIEPQEAIDAAATTERKAAIERLIGEMAMGFESYSVSQFVLRRITVIASNSTIKPSLVNVNKVYSTAELKNAELIPETIRFDLPGGQWLKRTPTADQTAADKWTITQEWWFSERFSLYYPDAT